jgi:hypothetical protein
LASEHFSKNHISPSTNYEGRIPYNFIDASLGQYSRRARVEDIINYKN